MIELLSINSGRLVAGGLATGLFAISYAPYLANENIEDAVERFAFNEHKIEGAGTNTIRSVHPDYAHMAGWISAVGASVAVGDIDGDGLPNDLCLVDPRDDSVSLRPALPEENTRFAPFTLNAGRALAGPPIAPMGCLLGDADLDGQQDVIVYYWGRSPVIFHRTGELAEAGFTVEELAEGEVWYTNAALFTDIDGDGYGDFLFGNYFPDESGVLDPSGSRPVEMQHSMSRADNAGQNRLFLNESASRGTLDFADTSDALADEMKNGWTLALGAADLTDDGLPEIYVANDFGPDRLLLNASTQGAPAFSVARAKRTLTGTKSTTLGHDSFKGMGVDFADIDGDGMFDIYVSNIAEEYALHESHFVFMHDGSKDWSNAQAPYQNASGKLGLARSGWSWDAKFADLDNDGHLEALQATGFVSGEFDCWPELHELAMGNDELLKFPGVWPAFGPDDDVSGDRSDAFFVRGKDGRFHDVAEDIGLGDAAVSRGIALADMDGDGDLDFAVARQWEASAIFENINGNKAKSLTLDLQLTNPNGTTRPALGAVVRAVLPDGRKLLGLVDASNGHSGSRAPAVHFGLGDTDVEPVALEVSWRGPDGFNRRNFSLSPGAHSIILDDIRAAELRSFEEAPL